MTFKKQEEAPISGDRALQVLDGAHIANVTAQYAEGLIRWVELETSCGNKIRLKVIGNAGSFMAAEVME